MSYDPTLILDLNEVVLTFQNNNLHWAYVVVTVTVDEETEEQTESAAIEASENHIDPMQYWESSGKIYYKIGWFDPVADGKRKAHLLWGDANCNNVNTTQIINNTYNEPTIITNNYTTVINISQNPAPGSVRVFLNGTRLNPSAYTVNGLTVTLNDPPNPGEKVLIKYAAWKTGETTPEIPVGDIDGVNKIFTLSHAPEPQSLEVYRNGILQDETQVTLTDDTFTFTEAPYPGEWVMVYSKALPETGSKFNITPAGDIDGENTAFTLPFDPSTGILKIYLTGPMLLPFSQYSIAGSIITFVEAPYPGEWILVDFETFNT